jgi:hypothetical protein
LTYGDKPGTDRPYQLTFEDRKVLEDEPYFAVPLSLNELREVAAICLEFIARHENGQLSGGNEGGTEAPSQVE